MTLNRPAALNALTHPMVTELAAALDRWKRDPAVTRVVVTGAGGRAFSAGGDIRALYEDGRAGRQDRSLAFWADEYRLNVRIKRFPKPYVALIDGIVMGGGVGVSLHGSHRVAGERYRFAMPEVGIGFFPDVGATWALPRLPGAAGTYLALTGARVGPADAGALGLATHVVASERLPAIEADLAEGRPLAEALGPEPSGEGGPILAERGFIDRCFSVGDVREILERLDRAAAEGSAFAADTAAAMRTKAPSSLSIACEQMRRGRDLTFEDAMRAEFRIVSRIAHGHDFYEGVRATLIDKTGDPRWRPPSLAEIDPAWVSSHFAPLGPNELDLGPTRPDSGAAEPRVGP